MVSTHTHWWKIIFSISWFEQIFGFTRFRFSGYIWLRYWWLRRRIRRSWSWYPGYTWSRWLWGSITTTGGKRSISAIFSCTKIKSIHPSVICIQLGWRTENHFGLFEIEVYWLFRHRQTGSTYFRHLCLSLARTSRTQQSIIYWVSCRRIKWFLNSNFHFFFLL